MLLDHKNFLLGCTLRRGLSAILTVLFKIINCFLPIQNLYDLKYETYQLNIPEFKKIQNPTQTKPADILFYKNKFDKSNGLSSTFNP